MSPYYFIKINVSFIELAFRLIWLLHQDIHVPLGSNPTGVACAPLTKRTFSTKRFFPRYLRNNAGKFQTDRFRILASIAFSLLTIGNRYVRSSFSKSILRVHVLRKYFAWVRCIHTKEVNFAKSDFKSTYGRTRGRIKSAEKYGFTKGTKRLWTFICALNHSKSVRAVSVYLLRNPSVGRRGWTLLLSITDASFDLRQRGKGCLWILSVRAFLLLPIIWKMVDKELHRPKR